MRNSLKLLPIVLAAMTASCTSPFSDSADTPLTTVRENYVLLWSGIPGVLGMTASAVVLADGLAATNGHVVAATSQLAGLVSGQGLIPVEVLAVSPHMDLALLSIPRGIGRPLLLGRAAIGQEAWLMGAPMAWFDPVSHGAIVNDAAWSCDQAADHCDPKTAPLGLMIAAKAHPGYSGGPVVNAHGQLVGLTQGIFTTVLDSGGNPLQTMSGAVFAYSITQVVSEARRLVAGSPHAAALDQLAQNLGDDGPAPVH